ncbi:MAG: HEAT repeat domain-containing protein [Candidatus Wallbacteria bacterium]|nr:HEAT repeat domain-containing protein [Candidatus Wallbacteria bacterium]
MRDDAAPLGCYDPHIMESPPQADARFPLLESASEEERLEGLRQLLSRGPDDLDIVLRRVAGRDPAARIRYAARKALALRERALPASRPPAKARDPLEDLRSPDAAVRLAAAQQAATSGPPRAAEVARELLGGETDPAVRARLVTVLERFGNASDLTLALPLLRDPDNRVRANAVLAAAAADLMGAAPHLMTLLADPDHRVRANSTLSLSTLGEDQVVLCLERMLSDESVAMRDASAFALSQMRNDAALPLLRRALTDKNPMVREKAQRGLRAMAAAGHVEAARVLDSLGHEEAVPRTAEQVPDAVRDLPVGPEKLADPNPKVRIRALSEAISDRRVDLAGEIADRLEREDNDFVLSKILVALGELGERAHASAVKRFLQHPEARVAASAIESLTKLQAWDRAASVRPLLSLRSGRARAAAVIFLAKADRGFDALAHVQKMLGAREYDLRLSGIYALAKLDPPDSTLLLEPLLSDFSAAVREKAFDLLEARAGKGDEMARDLIEMCRQGFVERKERSLKLVAAPKGKRLLALYADMFALGLLTIPIVLASLWMFGLGNGVFTTAICSVVLGLLFFFKDSLRGGRGIGKGSAGLRVVDLERYAACSMPKALLRQAMLGVPVLNLVEAAMVLFRADGRRLADLLLNTQVVDEQQRPLTVAEHLVLWVFTAFFVVCFFGAAGRDQPSFGRTAASPSYTPRSRPGRASLTTPNIHWRLSNQGSRRAVMRHTQSSGAWDADLTLEWREFKPRRKMDAEASRRAEVQGTTSLVAATLTGKGGAAPAHDRRDASFAGGAGESFDTELSVRGSSVALRCLVWSRDNALVTARLMVMGTATLDGFESDVETAIENAGTQLGD